jgi:hypothetical protein
MCHWMQYRKGNAAVTSDSVDDTHAAAQGAPLRTMLFFGTLSLAVASSPHVERGP